MILSFISVAFSALAVDALSVQLKQIDGVFHCKRTKYFELEKAKIELNAVTDTTILACYCHQIAVEYYNYEKDFINAIYWNKKAHKFRSRYEDGLLWKSNLNLGLCYLDLNDYKLAIKHFTKAYQIVGYKRPRDSINILTKMAQSYAKVGDIENSISYVEKAIKVNANKYHSHKAIRRYCQVLLLQPDSINATKSIKFLKKMLDFGLEENNQQYVIELFGNLGVAYKNIGNVDAELEMYRKALEKLSPKDLRNKTKILNNIATHYQEVGEYKLAIENLNNSINLLEELYDAEYDYEYAVRYINLGDNYTSLKQYNDALIYFQRALIHLTNNFRAENIFENPTSKDTSLFVYSTPDMIEVLSLKAKASYQYYQQNKNPKYLNLAHQTFQTLIGFHNKLQQDISTENSRLFQAKNILEYLENALEVAYEKQTLNDFDAEATFRFMEKNKATVLLQSMNEADALQFANLPDSLLEQEKDLKITTAFYERKLNDAKINEDTITFINQLENTLLESKEKYHRLIKTLEENYPDYYKLKYQQNKSTLTEVQCQLSKGQALLEYFVGFKHFYMLSIQQNNSKLYQIEKPKDWEKRINDFVGIFKNSALSDDLQNSTQVKYYVEQANFLYKILLQQPLNDLDESITHLQIISDAELNYIPFDVLFYETMDTTNELTFRGLPYLLKSKAIAYAYSAKLWLDNVNSKPLNKPIAYGGYASQHQLKEANIDLPIARKQVQNMAELFKGKPYIANKATKSAFLKDTLAYNILQFAMHGEVNDTLPLNSHLVFTKTDSLNKLYAADLYNIKLQTDLAVLGACNTGTGKVQKGEGVMSLSRAFTYAGCPSLVMSLWSIPDVSSAKVLEAFFKNLKEGYPKDVALQKAKLNFLETSEKTHPRNWAGLVAVGNLEALDFAVGLHISKWLYFISAIGILITIILLITIKKLRVTKT